MLPSQTESSGGYESVKRESEPLLRSGKATNGRGAGGRASGDRLELNQPRSRAPVRELRGSGVDVKR